VTRYYDPTLGRFIQPDTIVPQPGDPQSLNRYSYAGNNPVRYTDPSGHRYDPCGPDGMECGGGGSENEGYGPGWNWRQWVYRYIVPWIPFIGSGAQIHQGFNTARSAAQSPDFARQQLIYQQWSAVNCPGVCHRSPEATEAAYGEDVWRWRNQPRPDTPLVDAYSSGVGDMVGGGISLVFETYIVSKAINTFYSYHSRKLENIANDVTQWVSQGDDIIVIKNADGDLVLRNASNTRRFRIDFNRPYPHENPHMHLEWINENGKWMGKRIFPLDVEPR